MHTLQRYRGPLTAYIFAVLCKAVVLPALAQSAPDYSALRTQSAALSKAGRVHAKQLFATAFTLWQSGDFAAAEVGFRKGLDIDPANATANYYYGDCLARRKDKGDARDYLQRAVTFGGDSAEALKAQAEIATLSAAPTSVSDMTPDEIAAAYVGHWSGQLMGGGFGSDSDPIQFTISGVTNNQLVIQGSGPGGLSTIDQGHVLGTHITIVVPHSISSDQVLDGHLQTPTHMEGFISAWGPAGGKWSVDKQ